MHSHHASSAPSCTSLISSGLGTSSHGPHAFSPSPASPSPILPISPNLSQIVPQSPTFQNHSRLGRSKPRLLSPLQSQALDLLFGKSHHSLAEIASRLGVSRRTLSRWLHHDPTFIHHRRLRSAQFFQQLLKPTTLRSRPILPTPSKMAQLLANSVIPSHPRQPSAPRHSA